ncbi:hypothetical protein J4466_04050 [Candidatus Pacearchaeota archaeon]|nr:hypothetical protein [Candidatus Pacearchaeota archaeon]
MVEVNLKNCDDPLQQIKDCLVIIKEIDNELSLNKPELIIDLTNLEWILPCSALLLSDKISQVNKTGQNIVFKEPLNKSVKNYLSIVGFPFGKEGSSLTYMPIHHFSINERKESQK